MRKILVIFLVAAFLFLSNEANAYKSKVTSQSISQEQMDAVELIPGTPKRKFIRIQPVMKSAYSLESAIKSIKKSAVKMGANAIIEVETSASGESGHLVPGLFGYYYSTSYNMATIKGWAVKWGEL